MKTRPFFSFLFLALFNMAFYAEAQHFEGYDIVVIAGQSNAVGFGTLGPLEVADPLEGYKHLSDKIYQMGRGPDLDMKLIAASNPLHHWNHEDRNSASRGFGMAFALRYAQRYLSPIRRVLLIPAARSGSSIMEWDETNEYGEGHLLYTDMKKRIQTALALPGKNRLVAFHWQQGEADIKIANVKPINKHEELKKTKMKDASEYKKRLSKLIEQLRSDFSSEGNFPIIVGEPSIYNNEITTASGEKISSAQQLPFVNATKEVVRSQKCVGFVGSKDLGLNTNESTGNVDPVHFSAQGQWTLGARRARKFTKLVKEGCTVTDPFVAAAYDFMIMDVCVDPATNTIIPSNNLFRLKNCPVRRNLATGEAPPYYAGAWGFSGVMRRYMFPSSSIGTDQNAISYPIVLGWTDHNGRGNFSATDNVSVMSIQNGYASGLASTGGDILSINLGKEYSKPDSTEIEAAGIGRFSRAWMFFKSSLAASYWGPKLPSENMHYTTSSEQLENMTRAEFEELDGIPAANPNKLRPYFSLQVHKPFAFGLDSSTSTTLDAIIENKYSATDSEGLSPGISRAMERVYFTKELGQSRWEAWKSYDDNASEEDLHPESVYGSKLRRMCGKPAQILPDGHVGFKVSKNFILGPVVEYNYEDLENPKKNVSSWSQNVQSMENGNLITRTWYLRMCADWTNVTPAVSNVVPENIVNGAPLLAPFLNLLVAPK